MEPATAICSEDEEWDSDELEEHDEIEANSEPVDSYDFKIYYPLTIGEVLDNKYTIVHKLGWGGCSTVWMAYDTKERKYVALKILTSANREHTHGESETINGRLQGLRNSNLVTYHKMFELPADKKSHVHRVLVFPFIGPNLDQTCLEMPTSTHMNYRMFAAWQLLLRLKDLHEAKIVHRDLNPGAVMWGMKSLNEYNMTAIYKIVGQPRQFDLGRLWKRGDLVKPMTIPKTLREDNIYLGYFGMATKDGTAITLKKQTPARFCAPERFHNADPSFASDMWSYMCIFAWLYLDFHPICGYGGFEVMSYLVDALGPLPEQWHGSLSIMISQATIGALRQPAVSQEEQELVVRVFEKVFCYEPTYRWTAAQLLEDPDFIALTRRYISDGEIRNFGSNS